MPRAAPRRRRRWRLPEPGCHEHGPAHTGPSQGWTPAPIGRRLRVGKQGNLVTGFDYQDSDLNEANIRAGFLAVMDGVEMGGRDPEPAFRAFRDAIWSGERDGGQRAIDLYIGPFGWRWPRLGQAAADLDGLGIWPVAWRDLGLLAPLVWDGVDPMIRTRLLFETLHAGVWRARAKASAEEFPFLYGLRLQPPPQPCPAAAHFIERFSGRVEQGDYGRLPPFFPGDRTGLRLALKRAATTKAQRSG